MAAESPKKRKVDEVVEDDIEELDMAQEKVVVWCIKTRDDSEGDTLFIDVSAFGSKLGLPSLEDFAREVNGKAKQRSLRIRYWVVKFYNAIEEGKPGVCRWTTENRLFLNIAGYLESEATTLYEDDDC